MRTQTQQRRTIGTTYGIAARSCSREHRRAEQVYVRHTSEHRDPDGTHPIELDAWVGYGSVANMALTRRQASDLVGVLTKALLETETQ